MVKNYRACPPHLRAVFDELEEGIYQRYEVFSDANSQSQLLPTHSALACYQGEIILGEHAWQSLKAFHQNLSSRAFGYVRRGKSIEPVILHAPEIVRTFNGGHFVRIRLIQLR